MLINKKLKTLIMGIIGCGIALGIFLIYSLGGLNARPIVFSPPPPFVEAHAMHIQGTYSPASKEQTVPPKDTEKSSEAQTSAIRKNLTRYFSQEEQLVRQVILEGDSPELLIKLFNHSEKSKRVKVALAFADVNVRLNHDEESGFATKKQQFWKDAAEYIPDIQNALFEALITSAEEKTLNYIPYTLAWMPGQDHKTIQILAWAADHHPEAWIRQFSVFFVVEYGQDEALSDSLLRHRTHDPDYDVRKEVLRQRIRRITEKI